MRGLFVEQPARGLKRHLSRRAAADARVRNTRAAFANARGDRVTTSR